MTYTIKKITQCLCLFILLGTANAAWKSDKDKKKSGLTKLDFKANEMLKKGLDYLKNKQEERGVKLIQSVPRMFPKSKIRFNAYIALGKFYKKKRNFDLAIKQFKLIKSEEPLIIAEALYESGICFYNMNDFDKAFMSLRKVTNEYPWTVYANESYYYIGLCHFRLKRWAKSVAALKMVGASVPTSVGKLVLAEAGQRFYVKIYDKDLVVLKQKGGKSQVEITSDKGDKEILNLGNLGQSGEYYIGSLPTVTGLAKPNDGKIQIIGGDTLTVTYIDQNTETGKRNVTIISNVKMVSTAVGGFTDGAYREYTKGVFADSECFVRIKDLDKNTTDKKDTITCKLYTQYVVKKKKDESLDGVDLEEEEDKRQRDLITLTLTETGPQTGIFVGKTKPQIVEKAEDLVQGDATLSAMEGDNVLMEYLDEINITKEPRTIKTEAKVLTGSIKDVKIEHRHVSSLDIKAKKLLIEAQIYLKLGTIFKEVGLNKNAYENAAEGISRAEEVIRLSLKASLDRSTVEKAFSIKWDLLLVQDKLKEAIQVCRTLTQLFPDSSLVDNALLKIGVAKMNSKDKDEIKDAIGIFNSILGLKKSTLKPTASFYIAEVLNKQSMASQKRDLSQAMLAYQKCAETFPDSPYAGKSLEKIANFYISTKDYQRAVNLMERVFEDYEDASFLDKMLWSWAVASYRLKDYQTAKDKLDLLLADYPNSAYSKKALKVRASIIKKLNK
ncbi:MAG: tetratricopeptide repeat protein [Lentisphaeria bacterium]|nr:tetratricopeptide repeat protein [Lentisphaeria bacterium]